METFEEYLTNQGKSNLTIINYGRDITNFLVWCQNTNGQAMTPNQLTATDLRDYKTYLAVINRCKPATVNRSLAAIRAWVTWAIDTGQLTYNPIAKIKGMKEQPLAPKWLDKHEQSALIREAEKNISATKSDNARLLANRDYTILVVMLNTGLRISEICGLIPADMEITDRKGQLKITGKGDKHRVIPLNLSARQVIQAWMKIRPGSYKTMFACQPRSIQLWLSELGRRAHLGVTPHVLRHSFAKNLIDAGISLEKVAALLGHNSLNTTRIYTTPGQRDLERAVEQLD